MKGFEETKANYNKYAKTYESSKHKKYIEKYIQSDFDLFLSLLYGNKVLDLGSGPGLHSVKIKEEGYLPTCVDISESMVDLCKEKGLDSYVMNMMNLEFEENTFDGVWAYTSLLHIPKNEVHKVYEQIKKVLKYDGVLMLGMKQGNFEGFIKNKKYPDNKRFFSLYEKEELIENLEPHFNLLTYSEVKLDEDHVYMNFLCANTKKEK